MEATEQFQAMLRTAGAVTGGAVVARRVVAPLVDRLSNQVGLTGDVRRLTRLAGLTAASLYAMSNRNEIIQSVGVGHGVAVVEEGIDWALTQFGGGGGGGNGNGEMQGGIPLLPAGLGSGYSSEYAATPAMPTASAAEPSFAPGA